MIYFLIVVTYTVIIRYYFEIMVETQNTVSMLRATLLAHDEINADRLDRAVTVLNITSSQARTRVRKAPKTVLRMTTPDRTFRVWGVCLQATLKY